MATPQTDAERIAALEAKVAALQAGASTDAETVAVLSGRVDAIDPAAIAKTAVQLGWKVSLYAERHARFLNFCNTTWADLSEAEFAALMETPAGYALEKRTHPWYLQSDNDETGDKKIGAHMAGMQGLFSNPAAPADRRWGLATIWCHQTFGGHEACTPDWEFSAEQPEMPWEHSGGLDIPSGVVGDLIPDLRTRALPDRFFAAPEAAEPPAAPAGLTTAGRYREKYWSSRIVLSWDDPADHSIIRYQWRYRRSGSSDYNPWRDIPASSAASARGVVRPAFGQEPAAGKVDLQLRAVNGAGAGPHAEVLDVAVPDWPVYDWEAPRRPARPVGEPDRR